MEKPIVIESTKYYGSMTEKKEFYNDSMSENDIKENLLERRIKFGNDFGFDGTKIIVPLQKNSSCNLLYPDGKYVVLNEQSLIYQDIDLWNVNIPTDIMLIKKGIPGVMMAYPVADCPVVIMKDGLSGTLALSHCGLEYIDRELPAQIVDSLIKEGKCSEDNIKVYIGPSANFKNYTYENYPKWAKNNIWKYCIHHKRDGYHIDMRKAIISQLLERKIRIENIKVSKVDTITNPNYYSNSASFKGNKEKDGRFLVGTGYVDVKVKGLSKSLHR